MARVSITLALVLLTATAALVCDVSNRAWAAKKGHDETASVSPASAERILQSAEKALEAGNPERAIQQLSTVLSSTRLKPRIMARAFQLRGSAYRRQGKPAQAIADLTSALWLKGGLSDAERVIALAARSEAYREAGLTDLADSDARKAGKASNAGGPAPSRQSAQASASAQRPAEHTPKQTTSQVTGLSVFFSNLFGGSQPSVSGGSAVKSRPSAPIAGARTAIGEAWSSNTEIVRSQAAARQQASARADAPLSTASAEPSPSRRSSASGRYRVQVATVRSRQEAQAVAQRLRKDATALPGADEAEVDETVVGNMGTFYRVLIGHYANAGDPGALCPKLRSMGLDCLIVTD